MTWRQSDSDNRKIQRVQPLLLRLEKKENDDYVPRVVSLGPYHHGKPELALVEAFKPTMVDMFVSGGPEGNDREYYYGKVLEIVEDIKSCYELESPPKYSDGELADMMLCDATVVIFIMEQVGANVGDKEVLGKFFHVKKHIGSLIYLNLRRDIELLENQIPLFLIKLLTSLRYGEGKDDELLSRFFGKSLSRECNEEEPLHLLEASHRLFFTGSGKPKKTNSYRNRWLPCSGAEKDMDLETGGVDNEGNSYHFSSIFARVGRLLAWRKGVQGHEFDPGKFLPGFRSATDLKAKGIYFKARARSNKPLTDVSFRSHLFYARLQLPQALINSKTKVKWKNIIAYEVCPGSRAHNASMVSYVSFMKSLIQTPEDVKELREKNVIINMLDSDEEVLEMFRDIRAQWIGTAIFKEVHEQIRAHCSSRSKNWVAELVHANFQSPWKLIAFVAAVTLLAISAGQLYYAVHPN